jgi:ADP-dependent NAD(P)H-hydrate dehydratase / NAD(P)H-hydrate epimerase
VNPDNLPDKLYTAAGVRELDRIAIEDFGLSAFSLMCTAGIACVAELVARWPAAARVWVICGSGNNAGDGYIVAAKLAERQCAVEVRLVGESGKTSPAAQQALDYCLAAGVKPRFFEPEEVVAADVLVDALLGTGLAGEPRPAVAQAIDWINAAGVPVLAIDIPSGLSADTGRRSASTIVADVTVTFIGLKRGLFTHDGPDCAGEVIFDPLGLDAEVYEQVLSHTGKLRLDNLLASLPRRPRKAHKNHFGHVLIVGGDRGMGGAVAMSAEAALRAGAGLVSVATHPAHATALLARRPELMVRGIEAGTDLDNLVARASVLVLGPGLGQSDWSAMVFDRLIESEQTMVVDADGLNLLAKDPRQKSNWVLTPHPGEAARLLDEKDIEADRFTSIARLQTQYGGTVVLKGVGSLVADGAALDLCPYGNPGMATAGMGDVLAGVIAALLAQGLGLGVATRLAVAVHAVAGDRVALKGQRGMLATDCIPEIRRLLNPGLDNPGSHPAGVDGPRRFSA